MDHPLGDQIVASIGLSATSGAREIRAVLDDLAMAARDEARMLRRLEVSRQRPRSDMRQVIAIVVAVIGLLSLGGRDYLEPYSSLGGQLVLTVAGALWIGGFAWLARLGRVEPPRRFLTSYQALATELARDDLEPEDEPPNPAAAYPVASTDRLT